MILGPVRFRQARDFPILASLLTLALALARRGAFGGSLFQLSALALGSNGFGGSLFAVALKMNAEIMPGSLRKVDVVVFRRLLDIGEGQLTIRVGNVGHLIEPGDGVANVPGVGQRLLRCLGKA
jgi:hypothetical protein